MLDLNDLRMRVLSGEKLTAEISRELVAQVRGGRFTAANSTTSRGKKNTSPEVQADVLADLDRVLGL